MTKVSECSPYGNFFQMLMQGPCKSYTRTSKFFGQIFFDFFNIIDNRKYSLLITETNARIRKHHAAISGRL